MTEQNDPYENPSTIVPPGENTLTIDDEGNTSVERKDSGERSQIWKGGKAIQNCDDDKIRCMGMRNRSGIVDYIILGVSVSYRGMGNGERRQYLCHTHVVNDCPHTRRIRRYREERPELIPSPSPATAE